jgi:hypothetical protein
MTTEPIAPDATAEQVQAVAHILGVLLLGIGTAEHEHLGYVRLTVPYAHAVPAARLLAPLLAAAREEVGARDPAAFSDARG